MIFNVCFCFYVICLLIVRKKCQFTLKSHIGNLLQKALTSVQRTTPSAYLLSCWLLRWPFTLVCVRLSSRERLDSAERRHPVPPGGACLIRGPASPTNPALLLVHAKRCLTHSWMRDMVPRTNQSINQPPNQWDFWIYIYFLMITCLCDEPKVPLHCCMNVSGGHPEWSANHWSSDQHRHKLIY